jgi:predicted DCC family thiol-disulfide oxidoreductase YuxK
MSGPQPIWVFDGVCVLCSRAVLFTLNHERAPLIRFVAIQSQEGRALAARHGVDPDKPDSFLLITGNHALIKTEAIIALAAYLQPPWPASAKLMRILPLVVRDWLYDRIARNRYRLFGKRQTCFVPDAATRQRFVLPEESHA